MTRVVVIGGTGQLGTDVVRTFQEAAAYQVFPLGHTDIECTDPASVHAVLDDLRPDVVLNCAGYVRVDECEDRPEEAFRQNALGALYVARACHALRSLCVYVSTDYVFRGDKGQPYTEDDAPEPVNVYGVSKLAGEYLVRQSTERWLIIRLASLFGRAGARGKGGNFVETVLAKARGAGKVQVVDEIRISPTYTLDAARTLERLIRHGAAGIFHVTNSGSCTWYELAGRAIELAGIDARVEPVSAAAYASKARRPKDSSLTSTRLLHAEVPAPRFWAEALAAYLREKGHITPSSG